MDKLEYLRLELYLKERINNNAIKTNWYAISGAPCSGKTTTVNMLAEMGFCINPDAARNYIEYEMKQGLTKIQVRANLELFRRIIFLKTFENISTLPVNMGIFHDYSFIDNLSFYIADDIFIPSDLYKSIKIYRYEKVFLLDPLPYYQDDVRIENDEYQIRIDHEMRNVYKCLGYNVISIPVMPALDRVYKILSYIYD